MPLIADVSIALLEHILPPGKAYGMARGLNPRRACGLVTVRTSDGLLGCGEALGPIRVLREYLAIARPFLLGQSLFDFEIAAARLGNTLYHFGSQGHMAACLSGISIAVHDAIGRTLGLPIHNLIGGRSADSFACYATTGFLTENPEDGLERQLVRVRDLPFRGVKIKIGIDPRSDLERVRLARQILGPDMLLMVDMNGNYTADTALRSLRAIADHDIHWCEEPVPPGDVAGYVEVRARSPIPIAAGEAHHSVAQFKQLLDARAVDIVMPTLTSCGGYGNAKAIATLASLANVRLSPGVWGGAVALAATLHYAASLPVTPHSDNVPYPMLIEYDVGENPMRDELLCVPIHPTPDGLQVPTGPGLGVEIDPSAVERYQVH